MFSWIQGIGAVLLGVFLAFITTFGISNEYTVTPPSLPEHAATGTPAAALPEPGGAPSEEIPEPEPVKDPAKPAPKPVSTVSSTELAPAAPAQQAALQSPGTLNETVRAAVVNILCLSEATSPLNSITASGVIIAPSGIILTNSHVAQYFLLKDYPRENSTNCLIRAGNPAKAMYRGEIVFMPASWIYENAQKIKDETPMGNGSHDYALLRITKSTDEVTPLPSAFPYLAISPEAPKSGQSALIAAYPAGFLGGAIIQKELYQTSSLVTVGELYTFKEDTLDLFSLGSSVLAQQGSSGGAAANQSGQLMGLIVTSTDAPETSGRELRALSMPYLIRDFEGESGRPLMGFLSADLSDVARTFAENSAPALQQTLISALEGR